MHISNESVPNRHNILIKKMYLACQPSLYSSHLLSIFPSITTCMWGVGGSVTWERWVVQQQLAPGAGWMMGAWISDSYYVSFVCALFKSSVLQSKPPYIYIFFSTSFLLKMPQNMKNWKTLNAIFFPLQNRYLTEQLVGYACLILCVMLLFVQY